MNTQKNPCIVVDLKKLEQNTRIIVEMAQENDMGVAGVVKACGGEPLVAQSMLRGGVTALADSRLSNLEGLRRAIPQAQLWMLRLPQLSEMEDLAQVADVVLVSHVASARALGEAARRAKRTVRIILMVDVGDLREGVWPDEAVRIAERMADLPGVSLAGIGTNLACYGGVVPDENNMQTLLDVRNQVEKALGKPLELVSGGNSANLNLLMAGGMPAGINNLRVGEALLLGCEAARREPIPGAHQDVFTLEAEVIEVAVKPSVPIGTIGQDAFGGVPTFTDEGMRKRVILAVGQQDTVPDGLEPRHAGCRVLGASGDHLIVDVTDSKEQWEIGDVLSFGLNYAALVRGMTSTYVSKRYLE